MLLRHPGIGLSFGLLLLSLLACAAPQRSLVDSLPTYHGPKKIFAVLEFENATDYGNEQLSRVASDMLIVALKRTERFLVVERERLSRVLEEEDLGQTGPMEASTQTKVGQILGAQFLVMGTISEVGFRDSETKVPVKEFLSSVTSPDEIVSRKVDSRVIIDVRAVEVKSGRVIWAGKAEGGDVGLTVHFRLGSQEVGGGMIYDETTATKTLRRAIDRCAYEVALIMKERPWEGRIARMGDQKIFVVGGRDAGVKVKSEVEIFKAGPGLIDPAAGESLEMPEEKIGRGEVVRVEEHYSVVEIKEGSGFSFDDLVRLAER